MMLMSPDTHAAYADVIKALRKHARLRTRQLYELFPAEPKRLLSARLMRMEQAGYIAREAVCVNGHGGRLYRLGATSLPVFNRDAARAVYERSRNMFVLLASYRTQGRTAPELHRACDEGARLSVTASRLSAWERAGKVRCCRDEYPHRWFALHATLPGFDSMVAAEALRRRNQGQPVSEAQSASLRVAARNRMQRESAAIDRLVAKMLVAPWLASLLPKPARSTSWGVR
jgi:hypothetical protein